MLDYPIFLSVSKLEKFGLTKVTRRGQITIPTEARQRLRIRENDYVAVYGSESLLVLKKMPLPELNQKFEEAVKAGEAFAEEKKVTRKAVDRALREVRHG
jgi:AbrB family looped-hinge helix DNA binding protein